MNAKKKVYSNVLNGCIHMTRSIPHRKKAGRREKNKRMERKLKKTLGPYEIESETWEGLGHS